MKLRYKHLDLNLEHTFTIARSSRGTVPVTIVSLEMDGITAYGEASPNSRYGETSETVAAFLNTVDPECISRPFDLEQVHLYLDSLSGHDPSAKAAVDIALHDWIGKKLGVPLYSYFGIEKPRKLVSSFTIGIDTPEKVKMKVKEAENYPILKIKLGTPDDKELVRAVRSVTDKPLRVDANEGWKTKEEAVGKIEWLAAQNVELVEQPMPSNRFEDMTWVRERAGIPMVADEALDSEDSLDIIADAYNGVNVKVQKLGGLFKSRRLIDRARRLGLKVMIGCMIESSVGISAAAQLAPLADWIDLDGNVLINNDPFSGIANMDGEIILSELPGLGVSPAG